MKKRNNEIDKKRRGLLKVTLSAFISGSLFSCDKKKILNKLKNPNNIAKSPIKVNILRPPGAVEEREFTKRCIRCGRCGEVCPYRSIKFFDVREAGIFSFLSF